MVQFIHAVSHDDNIITLLLYDDYILKVSYCSHYIRTVI